MNKIRKPKWDKALNVSWVLALALVSGLFFGGCTREEGFQKPDDEAKVLLTVSMPEESLPSRASAGDEDYVGDLRIFVLGDDGAGGFEYLYMADAVEISAAGSNQRFQAQLRVTDQPIRLMMIANAAGTANPTAGMTEAAVRALCEVDMPSGGMTGNLPMYGEYTLPDGLIAGNNSITVALLRAVARVDVNVALESGSGTFDLENVYVYRPYTRARLIPDQVADTDSPVVTAPSIPAGAVPDNAAVLTYNAAAGAVSIEKMYIFESLAAANAADRLKGTTTIVVGGRYNGSATTTYYRADFDPDATGTSFGQALRNHRYIFNIKKVSAAGWATPEEAANNFNSSIMLEIQAWEDFSADIQYGTDDFRMSAQSLNLRYTANRTKTIDIESQKSYTIQWLDASGNPTGTAVTSVSGGTISNGDFEVTLDPASAGLSQLEFCTLKDNTAGTSAITHKLRITVGVTTIDITVNQDYSAMYAHRSFNVMTGYDGDEPFGYLGYTYDQDPWIGWSYYPALAMRAILDVNFAPTATVGVGGFAFEMITDAVEFLGATTSTSDIERIMRTQDVIFLTYHTAPSTQVTTLLMRWLAESPNRVLILSVDDANTNVNVRSSLTSDGTWTYSITTGSYVRAGSTDANSEFFNGPFGAVAATGTYTRHDTTLGNCQNNTGNITPLIVSQNNASAIILGVNKSRKIIYLGDTNLFQHTIASGDTSGPLSNDAGRVTTDLDRLMANTWAWVVEQLIYGDQ